VRTCRSSYVTASSDRNRARLRACSRAHRPAGAGWNSTQAAETRSPHGPRSRPAQAPSTRADDEAAGRVLRAVRSDRRNPGPPDPQTRRPRPARTGTTQLGRPHGQETTQDPRGLLNRPRKHPRWPQHRSSRESLESPLRLTPHDGFGRRSLGKGPAHELEPRPAAHLTNHQSRAVTHQPSRLKTFRRT
jgi:hypothetical protein